MDEPLQGPPIFSLIVPTRARTTQLRRLLESLQATTSDPQTIEVLLVVDADDAESLAFRYEGLAIKRVVSPPGQSMGSLNMAGYEASSGRYLMLLNDDVVAQTPNWDQRVLACFRSFPDDIVLIHVNDLIFGNRLCTFPLVSRTFCRLAGGICPRAYTRYRIDDHIEDIFNLLGVLGERRSVFLPEVVFEHLNFGVSDAGERVHVPAPTILARDAHLFDALAPQRKRLALTLQRWILRSYRRATRTAGAQRLEAIEDSIGLRVPNRLRVESERSPRNSGNTRVTIGVVASGTDPRLFRKCLTALERNTRNYELVLLSPPPASGNVAISHLLNRVLSAARTDHLVLLNDQMEVGVGWLDGLLEAMTLEVALVAPIHRARYESAWYWGIAFHPDGSGHHSHIQAPPTGPHPIFAPCSPVFLIDRAKCRHFLFDEAYGHAFFDIDFGLRVWEAGYRVICTPSARVIHLGGGPLPYGPEVNRKQFESDRQRFVAGWLNSGKLRTLESTVLRELPELRQLLDVCDEVRGLLSRMPGETLSEIPQQAEAAFDWIDRCPILRYALGEAGQWELRRATRDPLPGLAANCYRLWERLAGVSRQARRCLRRSGWLGLCQALWRRLLRRLSGGGWYPLPTAPPEIPNATLAARRFSQPRKSRVLSPAPGIAEPAGPRELAIGRSADRAEVGSS